MHHSNGNPCSCRQTPSDYVSQQDYVRDHPNKEPNFNEQIAAAIKKSNESRTSL